MLRRLAKFLAFLTVFGAGIGYLYVGITSKQDLMALEWTNVLIWKAVQSPFTPKYSLQKVRTGPGPNTWTVTGEITLSRSREEIMQQQYSAVIQNVCATSNDEKCWHLENLTIGSKMDFRPTTLGGFSDFLEWSCRFPP